MFAKKLVNERWSSPSSVVSNNGDYNYRVIRIKCLFGCCIKFENIGPPTVMYLHLSSNG